MVRMMAWRAGLGDLHQTEHSTSSHMMRHSPRPSVLLAYVMLSACVAPGSQVIATGTSNDTWEFSPSRFPSVWFGANATGPESKSQYGVETQYRSVMFGWQQSNSANHCKHEEQALISELSAVRQLSSRVSTVAYGANAESALRFYDWQVVATSNASFSGFFLEPEISDRGELGCSNPGGNGLTWDWRNQSARDFFVEQVIRPWVNQDSVDAVFVDEGDAVQCRYQQFPALKSLADVYAYTNGSVEVYRRAAAVLAAHGKRLILSLKNGKPGPIEYKIGVCPVPLDTFLDAMQAAPSAPFIRYHEYFAAFSGTDVGGGAVNGSAMCTSLIDTAVDQTQRRSIAISVHSGNYTPESSLELAFATFMVVRNAQVGAHEDFFGWSTADFWFSRDWSWNETAKYYTHNWGLALTPTTQTASGTYTRQYEGGTFTGMRASFAVNKCMLVTTTASTRVMIVCCCSGLPPPQSQYNYAQQ